MKDEGRACALTLIMEKGLPAAGLFLGLDYEAARESMVRLRRAGVPTLVSTDSNQSPMVDVRPGPTSHQELELLVDAGLSNIEALKMATSLPAI